MLFETKIGSPTFVLATSLSLFSLGISGCGSTSDNSKTDQSSSAKNTRDVKSQVLSDRAQWAGVDLHLDENQTNFSLLLKSRGFPVREFSPGPNGLLVVVTQFHDPESEAVSESIVRDLSTRFSFNRIFLEGVVPGHEFDQIIDKNVFLQLKALAQKESSRFAGDVAELISGWEPQNIDPIAGYRLPGTTTIGAEPSETELDPILVFANSIIQTIPGQAKLNMEFNLIPLPEGALLAEDISRNGKLVGNWFVFHLLQTILSSKFKDFPAVNLAELGVMQNSEDGSRSRSLVGEEGAQILTAMEEKLIEFSHKHFIESRSSSAIKLVAADLKSSDADRAILLYGINHTLKEFGFSTIQDFCSRSGLGYIIVDASKWAPGQDSLM